MREFTECLLRCRHLLLDVGCPEFLPLPDARADQPGRRAVELLERRSAESPAGVGATNTNGAVQP